MFLTDGVDVFQSAFHNISVLVLLDLSAAFDTVDHNILLDRLENWVGVSATALNWYSSYLKDRTNFVSIGNYKSTLINMSCRVPQGSILGPLLFNIYMLPLVQIINNSDLSYHIYADDTQIYFKITPGHYSPIRTLSKCIELINDWMTQNFLQLKKQKTEIIVFGTKKDRLKVIAELQSADCKSNS